MHFNPSHPEVVARIVGGLNVGEDAEQLVSLAYFDRVAVSADAESLVAGTLQHMFQEGRDWMPSTQQVILRALEVVASRSYDGVRLGLLKHLIPTRPVWMQLLAAELNVEDLIALLQSFAIHLPNALGEVVNTLCLELEKDNGSKKMAAVNFEIEELRFDGDRDIASPNVAIDPNSQSALILQAGQVARIDNAAPVWQEWN
eukprot:s7602_g1.t1